MRRRSTELSIGCCVFPMLIYSVILLLLLRLLLRLRFVFVSHLLSQVWHGAVAAQAELDDVCWDRRRVPELDAGLDSSGVGLTARRAGRLGQRRYAEEIERERPETREREIPKQVRRRRG